MAEESEKFYNEFLEKLMSSYDADKVKGNCQFSWVRSFASRLRVLNFSTACFASVLTERTLPCAVRCNGHIGTFVIAAVLIFTVSLVGLCHYSSFVQGRGVRTQTLGSSSKVFGSGSRMIYSIEKLKNIVLFVQLACLTM